MSALSSLPKTFGLDVQDKGFFPHLFTRRENLNRRLPQIPDRKFYQPEWMKPTENAKFERWYQQQQANNLKPDINEVGYFNLKEKLIEYCTNDVRILTEAVLKYRQQYIDQIGLDPFVASNTCASLSLNTYRALHLPADTMVHSPEGGLHRGFKASNIALRYIRCWEKMNELAPRSVQTDEWTIGEAPHPDDSGKRLDGLLYRHPPLRPLAIEFLGW